MGHPKQHRRKYATPVKPYDKERIDREKALLSSYGLRTKKEIWRAEGILRNFRRRARSLQASPDGKKQQELLAKLEKLGVKAASVDDILGISLEQVLDRRLQTVVYKKGATDTTKQARQAIIHGHVSVSGRKMKWPSYLVPVKEEAKIEISPAVKRAAAEAPAQPAKETPEPAKPEGETQ